MNDRTADELLEVTAFLLDGDVIALPAGNMAVVFRVAHDDVKGETTFNYEGIAALTGQFNTVRRMRS